MWLAHVRLHRHSGAGSPVDGTEWPTSPGEWGNRSAQGYFISWEQTPLHPSHFPKYRERDTWKHQETVMVGSGHQGLTPCHSPQLLQGLPIGLFWQKDISLLISIRTVPRRLGSAWQVTKGLGPEWCPWRCLNGFKREPVTSGCCDN